MKHKQGREYEHVKRLLAISLIAALGAISSFGQDQNVYWTELGGRVGVGPATGGVGPDTLFTTTRPRGIAIDPVHGKVYWTNDEKGAIESGNLDGTGAVQDIVTGLTTANYGIALDVCSDTLYWTEGYYTNLIRRAKLDGSQAVTLYSSGNGLEYPTAVALDLTAGKIYVAEFQGGDRIRRANLDGSGQWETLVAGLNGPTDVALDLLHQKMYWCLPYSGLIQRSNLDGSQIETVIDRSISWQPEGISLDPAGGKMYFTDVFLGKIVRANLDGTGAETLYTGLSDPTKIAIGILYGNRPPVARCQDVTVAAGPECTANASIDNGSFDCDAVDTITLSQDPPGPYPLGETTVTLTVTDSSGASSNCTATVTVVDDTPPQITCPANIVTDATSPAGAVVNFEPTASDNCSVASVSSTPSSGSTFAIGTTTVTCRAIDGAGLTNSCTFTIRVNGAVDADGDGVPNNVDQCTDTPSGSIVNSDGCSIAQLVPCDGPASGGKWKSHGQYVRAVVATATDFLRAKLIARRQWMEIVTRAAWSKCGWNRRCDHDWDWNWHRNWDCDRDRDWGRHRNWDRD